MTTQIKKQYEDIITLMQANPKRTLGTFMKDKAFIDLVTASRRATSYLSMTDNPKDAYAVFCGYHKQWELIVTDEEGLCNYGTKSTSPTGHNTMCKVGHADWSATQRELAKVDQIVLSELMAGELTAEEVPTRKAKLVEDIEAKERQAKPIGYATEEEAKQAYLELTNQ